MQGDGEKKELSVADYDKRISLVSRVRATDVMESLYAEAREKFPKETKYTLSKSRSSARPKNVYQDIELQVSRLKALEVRTDVSDPAKHVKDLDVIRSRLSTLWNSVEHRVNSMEYLRVVDEHKREAYEESQKKKQPQEATATKGASKPAVDLPEGKTAKTVVGPKALDAAAKNVVDAKSGTANTSGRVTGGSGKAKSGKASSGVAG